MGTVIIQLIFSYLATVSFAILSNVPKRSLNACGLTGTLGWVIFQLLLHLGAGTVMSTLAGAFMVAIASHFFSKYKKMPITIFNVSGIVPLVPGSLAYQAVRNFVLGDYNSAIAFSVQVAMVAGAIAGGLMLSEVFNHSIRRFREHKERF
ncbi:threonine/serine exporter family protein [Listeria costaricensis]|uniref:threonine/serine exporter family protein n=1 Tax=Listeria costaricensis TaxID=2026604 RepID=UPI000C07A087|nr:threonine/serine exporter family protein [Listeria costaricensis]